MTIRRRLHFPQRHCVKHSGQIVMLACRIRNVSDGLWRDCPEAQAVDPPKASRGRLTQGCPFARRVSALAARRPRTDFVVLKWLVDALRKKPGVSGMTPRGRAPPRQRLNGGPASLTLRRFSSAGWACQRPGDEPGFGSGLRIDGYARRVAASGVDRA